MLLVVLLDKYHSIKWIIHSELKFTHPDLDEGSGNIF